MQIFGVSSAVKNIPNNTWTELGILPQTVKIPTIDIDIPLTYMGGEAIGFVRIKTTGVIQAYSNISTSYWAFYYLG